MQPSGPGIKAPFWRRIARGFARPPPPVQAGSPAFESLFTIPPSAMSVSGGTPLERSVANEGGEHSEGVLPAALVAAHNGAAYRTPTDLCRNNVAIRRVLIIGSCLAKRWTSYIKRDGLKFDYILTNNFSALPESPPAPIEAYDFQIIQLPLRSILHENTYSHLSYADIAAYERLFASARSWLSQYLDIALAWNEIYGLPAFVTNFLVPQQNPMGRLLPRDDLRNMVYFIEQLNSHLYEELARRPNAYLFDIDQISATIGKRALQDDGVWTISHGSTLNDGEFELDRARIVPVPRMSAHYKAISDGVRLFYESAWAELAAMFRTIRQVDSVKLVIFDLDDTLWRGVIAEEGQISADTFEGWPIGLMEAACFLKARGTLLAITSRNDESVITGLFDHIVGGRLRLDDFVARKINWRPKHENVREILEEVHLTPRNTVFVDDNPVERAAMSASFPEIRTLGAHPYYLRRILLWSAETQVPTMTDESMRRTEMVQAQMNRDQTSASMSRPDFLATLNLRMKIFEIRSVQQETFPRALELINKANQFNTTGRRLTQQECAAIFAAGGVFHAFELRDKFSNYGLVGLAIVNGAHILQFVMSCRVLGLGAEDALLAHIATQATTAGFSALNGDYITTDLNALARDLYCRNGFIEIDGGWQKPLNTVMRTPSYIAVDLALQPV